MLALAALVLAFAHPFIPAAEKAEKLGTFSTIYIDNSPSMLSGPEQNSLLSQARGKAVEIIRNLSENQRIQILTNDFQGRSQNFYTKAEAISLVDEIQPSYAFRESDEIWTRIEQARTKNDVEDLQVFLISDFQKAVFQDVESPNENWQLTLLPMQIEEVSANISIDSVWFEKPILQPSFDQELKVQVSQSAGNQSREVSLSLSVDDALLGAKKVEIPAEGKATASFTLRAERAANYRGEISVDAGPPFFDNQFYFSYGVAQPFNVLLTGENAHLPKFQKLFADSIYLFEYQEINAIDYASLPDFDLIILDAPAAVPSGLAQALETHLEAGKNAVLIPSPESPNTLNSVLNSLRLPALGNQKSDAKTLEISWEDEHFQNVFTNRPKRPELPIANQYYAFPRSGYPLLVLENGDPLASRIPAQSGHVFLITAPLSQTNLDDHPIFVPLLLNAALFSRENTPLYTISGKSRGPVFSGASDDKPLSIKTLNNEELIPRQRNRNGQTELYDLPPELAPAIYEVQNGQENVGFLALNPLPRESDWRFFTDEEIRDKLGLENSRILTADVGSLGLKINRNYSGTALWKWFVLAAIFFLLIEILLLKFWK